MTPLGILYFSSMIYLSGAICLSISVNENRRPAVIVKETFRRWIKFLALTLVIALVVFIMSR